MQNKQNSKYQKYIIEYIIIIFIINDKVYETKFNRFEDGYMV